MKAPLKTLLLVVSTVISLNLSASDTSPLRIEGHYFRLAVSPDLEHILLGGESGDGLYLYTKSTQEIKKISDNVASNYGYSWDDNGEQFYFLEKPEDANMAESIVMTYSISDGKAHPSELDINCTYLPSFHGMDEFSENQWIVYTDLDDLQIYAMDLMTREKRNVTQDPSSEFYSAILSHDQTKVAVHRDADIMIYTLDGSAEPYVIGQGIATEWSADDRYVLGFLDESRDGHELSGSEIYLFDTQTKKAKQITSTDTKIETDPAFYGEDQIIYSDPLNKEISTISITTQY